MKNANEKARVSQSLEQLLGYEGIASRNYFQGLSKLIEPDFSFDGRAVIVDAVVLRLIQGHEVTINDFEKDEENGGIIFTKEARRAFLKRLEMRMKSEMNYLSYVAEKNQFPKSYLVTG